MKLVHHVKINVFCKEGEDKGSIRKTLNVLLPEEALEEINQGKLKVQESTATGFKEKTITIIEVQLSKQKHVKAWIELFNNKLSQKQKETLLGQAESRLDAEMRFFIRLDKPALLKKEFTLTDKGNCFHITLMLAAYPKKKGVALLLVNKLFKPETNSA
jgi:RNA-binding protein